MITVLRRPMRLLGDAQEAAPVVFPEFNEEMLALNLELTRLEYGVHLIRLIGRSGAFNSHLPASHNWKSWGKRQLKPAGSQPVA